MARKRKHTLTPATLRLLELLGVKAWRTPDGWIAHNGSPELRDQIAGNVALAKDEVGLRKSAAYFAGVAITAMDGGVLTPAEIAKLDDLARGNLAYLNEKLKENESD